MAKSPEEKLAAQIIDGLDRGSISPELVAQMISHGPGHVQMKLLNMFEFLVRCWQTDARFGVFDRQYTEHYQKVGAIHFDY